MFEIPSGAKRGRPIFKRWMRAAARSSTARANQRCSGVGSSAGVSLIHRRAVLHRFVLGCSGAIAISFEVVDARHKHVVGRRHAASRVSTFDHDPTTLLARSFVEHYQQIDVGVRPVGASGHRSEQDDLDPAQTPPQAGLPGHRPMHVGCARPTMRDHRARSRTSSPRGPSYSIGCSTATDPGTFCVRVRCVSGGLPTRRVGRRCGGSTSDRDPEREVAEAFELHDLTVSSSDRRPAVGSSRS